MSLTGVPPTGHISPSVTLLPIKKVRRDEITSLDGTPVNFATALSHYKCHTLRSYEKSRNFSRSNLGVSRGPLKLREVRIHGTGLDVNMTASRSTRSTNIPDFYGRKHVGISAALHWDDELRLGTHGSVRLLAFAGNSVHKRSRLW